MNRKRLYRQLLLTTAVALTLGAGLVLAASQDFKLGPSVDSLDRRSAWVPGTDVPMLVYLGGRESLPAPPR